MQGMRVERTDSFVLTNKNKKNACTTSIGSNFFLVVVGDGGNVDMRAGYRHSIACVSHRHRCLRAFCRRNGPLLGREATAAGCCAHTNCILTPGNMQERHRSRHGTPTSVNALRATGSSRALPSIPRASQTSPSRRHIFGRFLPSPFETYVSRSNTRSIAAAPCTSPC